MGSVSIPKQRRSQELFRAILQSADQVFSRLGLDKASTNKIAERAGVSVGSLYRYFLSKENIIENLINEMVLSNRQKFADALEGHKHRAYLENIDLVTGVAFDLLYERRALLRVIFSYLFRADTFSVLIKSRRRLSDILYEQIQERYADQVELDGLKEALFWNTNAFMGVVQVAIFEDEANLDLQKVRTEAIVMSRSYLSRFAKTV